MVPRAVPSEEAMTDANHPLSAIFIRVEDVAITLTAVHTVYMLRDSEVVLLRTPPMLSDRQRQ